MSRFNVSYVYILLELDIRYIIEAHAAYHIDSYCL